MTQPAPPSNRILHIYISLALYPVLSTHIRKRMRDELFNRGVVTPQAFEAEVREKAIRSQEIEGLHNPVSEEPSDIWELRLTRIREYMTDFHFAYNLPYSLFEQIIKDVLSERGADTHDLTVAFNPELAPQSLLFEQAEAIERMSPEDRAPYEARLQEIKVVLIRTMISDQLAYLKIAKEWLTIEDLKEIRRRKTGQGKIGGKAAGMLLALRILETDADVAVRSCVRIPESYYLGADLTYTFMAMNGLMRWLDQKYKAEEDIRGEYPQIQAEFLKGHFPKDIIEKFVTLLSQVGAQPLIVRSSSLLEDNFGTSFAGKYDSFFLPNQGDPEENLADFTQAVIRIYASMLNPDALLYRRAKGLQDYDERMAVLIQVVQGQQFGKYYLPHAAGVAFSRNLYRWSPVIRREDGFLRLVWGLGTRAVDRVGDDFPRLVALSHPLLHPESSVKAIRRYSQQYVDVIDLEENVMKTLPVSQVLSNRYPVLRYLAQIDQGDYLAPIRALPQEAEMARLVLTFDGLFRRTALAARMRDMLNVLEDAYHAPVDTEFTVSIVQPGSAQPEVEISLLQCRPQSHIKESEVRLPPNIPIPDIIFSTRRMAPEGHITDVAYVIFVTPEGYFSLPSAAAQIALGRVISRLNGILKNEVFICVGPGRWGTSNPDLGVRITYGDIYHTRSLVELTGKDIGPAPEPSFGTHFFQDMVESNIYPLAINLDDPDARFNQAFFYNSPNQLSTFLPEAADWADCLRLIEVRRFSPGCHIELIMDDHEGQAVAFLQKDEI